MSKVKFKVPRRYQPFCDLDLDSKVKDQIQGHDKNRNIYFGTLSITLITYKVDIKQDIGQFVTLTLIARSK